jgi:hypothetical protein
VRAHLPHLRFRERSCELRQGIGWRVLDAGFMWLPVLSLAVSAFVCQGCVLPL